MTAKLNLKPLDDFAEAIDRALAGSGRGPMLDAIKQWGAIFRGWSRERFAKLSKGGGWEPLKPSTIKGRRKGKSRSVSVGRGGGTEDLSGGGVAILWDTGTLIGALDAHLNIASGGFQKQIRNGIRVGYGGSAKHPKGKGTIAMIANAHQTGAGNLPERKIIEEPPKSGYPMDRIVQVTKEALGAEWRRATA